MTVRSIRVTRGLLLGLALSIVAMSTSRAQDDAKAPVDDPGAPGPEHAKLDPLAGRWDVTVTYSLGEGREHQGTATCQADWVLDRRFLRQRYESSLQGAPFEVLQYLGFDRNKKKYIELKMDNMDTGLMHNEGTLDPAGSITFLGDRVDPEDGKSRPMRTVYTIPDPDHFTIEWFLTGADGQESRTVVLKHTRRAP